MSSTEETFDKAGGPAFPSVSEGGPDSGLHPEFNPGMTLRDWFAGQMLPRIATGWPNDASRVELARRCYEIADAMIAERSK